MPTGKIMKALAGFYYVQDGEKTIQCRGRGVFRKRNTTLLVGDEVVYQAENDMEGTVVEVGERKNELVRPPIANVDQAILVFAAVEPRFRTSLLNRFLTLIEFHQIEPIICISKIDLLDEVDRAKMENYAEDYRNIGYEVFLTSTKIEETVQVLYPLLKNKTTVLAGQSGAGKSSLLNALCPNLDLETNEISTSLGRGKHTTRHVELLEISGGLVADTPGFSSLDFMNIEVEDVNFCFPEILRLSDHCKFRGCTHIAEPNCAVKEALATGQLTEYRYKDYVAIIEEIKDRKPRY